MEEKVQGIVLGGVNYGENDKILSLLTPDKGAISARIKGVKKAGAKLKFASEPFCFAEYILLKNGDKRTVKSATLIDSFYPVREDIIKFYSACAVLDFAKHMFKVEVDSAKAFIETANTLSQIAYGKEGAKQSLLKYLLKGISLSGYGINLNGCIKCGKIDLQKPYFDGGSGGFLCEDCFDSEGREISSVTLNALRLANDDKELSVEQADFGLRLINYYLSFVTEERFSSLKELIKL